MGLFDSATAPDDGRWGRGGPSRKRKPRLTVDYMSADGRPRELDIDRAMEIAHDRGSGTHEHAARMIEELRELQEARELGEPEPPTTYVRSVDAERERQRARDRELADIERLEDEAQTVEAERRESRERAERPPEGRRIVGPHPNAVEEFRTMSVRLPSARGEIH